jgi:hypothetical protein
MLACQFKKERQEAISGYISLPALRLTRLYHAINIPLSQA